MSFQTLFWISNLYKIAIVIRPSCKSSIWIRQYNILLCFCFHSLSVDKHTVFFSELSYGRLHVSCPLINIMIMDMVIHDNRSANQEICNWLNCLSNLQSVLLHQCPNNVLHGEFFSSRSGSSCESHIACICHFLGYLWELSPRLCHSWQFYG